MGAIVDNDLEDREAPNLRERAYERFTRHLLAQDIRPGQFVSQRELVAMTGLPLGAIRELVPRLETEGLIRTVRRRGMQVAHVDLNLIRDAFEFRLFLEREAIAPFALKVSDGSLDRFYEEHDAMIDRYEAAAANGPIPADLVVQAEAIDWNFHATIIDALGIAIISEAYRVNAIKIRLIKQSRTRLNEAVLVPTMREHLGIIDVLRQRDPAAAMEAMGFHILNARSRAMDFR